MRTLGTAHFLKKSSPLVWILSVLKVWFPGCYWETVEPWIGRTDWERFRAIPKETVGCQTLLLFPFHFLAQGEQFCCSVYHYDILLYLRPQESDKLNHGSEPLIQMGQLFSLVSRWLKTEWCIQLRFLGFAGCLFPLLSPAAAFSTGSALDSVKWRRLWRCSSKTLGTLELGIQISLIYVTYIFDCFSLTKTVKDTLYSQASQKQAVVLLVNERP